MNELGVVTCKLELNQISCLICRESSETEINDVQPAVINSVPLNTYVDEPCPTAIDFPRITIMCFEPRYGIFQRPRLS